MAAVWASASSAFVGLAAATTIGAAPQIGWVVPAARPPVSAELSKIDVVNEFRKLTAEWKRHSPFLSIRESCRLPEYERIKKLGFAVVPLILKELEHEPDEWFSALEYLTEENPVADQDRGRLQAVTKAWLAWGRDRGLI